MSGNAPMHTKFCLVRPTLSWFQSSHLQRFNRGHFLNEWMNERMNEWFICQAQTQYRDNNNSMAGTERQQKLLLHPSRKKQTKMFYRRMYSVVRLAVKDEYRHVQCIGSTSLYFFVSLFFDVCLGALMWLLSVDMLYRDYFRVVSFLWGDEIRNFSLAIPTSGHPQKFRLGCPIDH